MAETDYTFCVDTFSDFYKDINGFRPRGHEFYDVSDDHKQKIWDNMEIQFAANQKSDEIIQDQNVETFKALMRKAQEYGAINEDQALRWLTQDEEFYSSQCVEQFAWEHGILFTDFGKEIVQKLNTIYF